MNCFQFTSLGLARQTITRHLPMGVAWIAWRMPGKVAYKLWSAFAELFEDMTEALCAVISELSPYTTDQLITEWETAVGLPDPCLPEATTLEERRQWVVWRLNKRRWVKAEHWQELAALFGLQIVVTPGWLVQKPALYPATYPRRYDLFPKLGRFRVYINIIGLEVGGYDYGVADRGDGYPVPYGYTGPDFSQFQCLIERVKPANVIIIWNAPLEHEVYGLCISESFDSNFSPEFC